MAQTITSSSTVAVTLSSMANNPLTVTGSGTIEPPSGTALSLQAPLAWTLFNDGLIAVSGASGEAVHLAAGGTIANRAGGTITGVGYGAVIAGGIGSATNAGLLQSGTTGIALDLAGGGDADNGVGARIAGGTGVAIEDAGGTLTNAGTISGYGSAVYLAGGTVTNDGVITSGNTAGVQLGGAASVTNAAGATIAGGFGVIETLGAAVVDNAGLLTGSTFDGIGVFFAGGGTVSNASGGTIAGNLYGVDIENGARTVINAGLITASRSVAVTTTFGGPGTAYVGNTGSIVGASGGIRITEVPGSVVNSGLIEGAGGYGVRLESGGNLVNAANGAIRAANGDIVYLAGAGTVTNAGTIAETGSALNAVYFRPGYANRLVADAAAVFSGQVNGGNSIGATAISVLELAAGSGAIGTVTNFASIAFDAGAGWTVSQAPLAIAGGETIGGFAIGDTIELTGTTLAGAGFASDTLTLFGDLSLVFPGTHYTGPQFSVTNSGGNTDVTVACFAAGARILTARGEIAVEALRAGDRVVSLTRRRAAPVRWIGARIVPCAAPVCIEAGAFGGGRPHRALWLSPDHAVFIGGVLVPVRALVNGASIAPAAREAVRYFHVELDEHAVLVADGLPAESYLDTGNRGAFDIERKLTPANPASQAGSDINAGSGDAEDDQRRHDDRRHACHLHR